MVKGVTAMQSWFVSITFSGLTSGRIPGVLEEEAHSCCLGGTSEKQTSAFSCLKSLPSRNTGRRGMESKGRNGWDLKSEKLLKVSFKKD